MTPRQIQLIHLAAHKVFGPHDRRSYLMLLVNVGGVETCKALTEGAFEDCMAVLEDSGFVDQLHGPRYWRKKAAGQGAADRMAHKVRELWEESDRRYPLDALVKRFSAGRTMTPEQLHPREAWNLIEMLKSCAEREAPEVAPF